MKKNLTFIYTNKFEIITGGQKYENDLRQALALNENFNVEILYLSKKPLLKLKFLFSPFLSLKLLNKIKKSENIIFNSSSFYTFFFLNFIISKILRKKTIIIHHHYILIDPKTLKEKILFFLEKKHLKISNKILTPSPLVKSQTKNLLNKDCVLCEIPFNNKVKITNNIRQDNKLLYVGTIEERKGILYLVEALKIVQELNIPYEMHIVGKIKNEKYYNNIKELIYKYNLNVIFHGFVTENELNNLYDTSDIFVFPSLQEGFGMSVNEAMCHGLPVICFNNSALPYSVNLTNGILVQNKNYFAFADAIRNLICDNNLKEKLRTGAIIYSKSLPNYESFNLKVNEIFKLI